MAKSLVAVNLSKEYRIKLPYEASANSLKELLNNPFTNLARLIWGTNNSADGDRRNRFYALKDINFNVERGESIGIIGKNGAGKSTLLKIISRIIRPSKGELTIYERVNSLLEIGTGFNADLSGRDNIFLNGSYLGMKAREIKNKFDEIVAFSEIGQFIDTPVKYYSSGMYVRLAFSVAAHLSPELLLLDEVLAVGDMGFQEKSKSKMQELINSGSTIIFVSHNLEAIREVCKRGIYLRDGSIASDAAVDIAIANYISDTSFG